MPRIDFLLEKPAFAIRSVFDDYFKLNPFIGFKGCPGILSGQLSK
jgi:hypothetical protein